MRYCHVNSMVIEEIIRNFSYSVHCKCLSRGEEVSIRLVCIAITDHLRLTYEEREFTVHSFQRLGRLKLWAWHLVRVFPLHLYMVESKRAKGSEHNGILTGPQSRRARTRSCKALSPMARIHSEDTALMPWTAPERLHFPTLSRGNYISGAGIRGETHLKVYGYKTGQGKPSQKEGCYRACPVQLQHPFHTEIFPPERRGRLRSLWH